MAASLFSSSVVGTNPGPPPTTGTPDGAPYDPATLTVPLGAKRAPMIAWMYKEALQPGSGISFQQKPETMPDGQLIVAYQVLIAGAQLKPSGTQIDVPGIGSTLDFLNNLSKGSTWIRAGEFAVGFLLIGIGVHGLMRGNSGYQSAVAQPTKKAAKAIGLLGPAGKEASRIGKVQRETRSVNANAARVHAEARYVSGENRLMRANRGPKK